MSNKKNPGSGKSRGNSNAKQSNSNKVDPRKVIVSKPIYIKENKQYPENK
jgi:hypothetical protein